MAVGHAVQYVLEVGGNGSTSLSRHGRALQLRDVIVGIVAAAISFSVRRDRRSPFFRVPGKEDD
jgi:hypothetical protein